MDADRHTCTRLRDMMRRIHKDLGELMESGNSNNTLRMSIATSLCAMYRLQMRLPTQYKDAFDHWLTVFEHVADETSPSDELQRATTAFEMLIC